MTTRPPDDSRQRDPRFDAAWRAISNEEPPRELDAAVLAAAHREVDAKPQSLSAQAATRARHRWWPLAAAAMVAVIAIGIVQRTGRDDLIAPPSGNAVVSDMPAQSATGAESKGRAPEAPASRAAPRRGTPGARGGAEEAHKADSVAPQEGAAPAESATDAERRAEPAATSPLQKQAEPATGAGGGAPSETKSAATAGSPVSPPEPFPIAQTAPESAALQRNEGAPRTDVAPPLPPPPNDEPKSPSPAGAPMAAPPTFAANPRGAAGSGSYPSFVARAGTAGPEEARAKARVSLSVADWIALIRRLRDDGNVAQAARELAAFRAAYADHEKLLPPDLRDWRPPEK